MAHPYIFAENFERGTKGNFDSETDTNGQLDFAHYRELARYPWRGAVPYSGAYAMRLVIGGTTAAAYLAEADVDVALAATSYFRFPIFFAPNFTATADDTFDIVNFLGAASAITAAIGARIVAATGEINIGAGGAASGAAPSTFAPQAIERGKWYTVECAFAPAAGTGTMSVFITKDGEPAASVAQIALTGITNIAVTDARFGIQNHLGTTSGVILLGDFTQDDARLYPAQRYNNDLTITQSGHVFVGPGHISGAALLTNEALNAMALWDTDIADTSNLSARKVFFDLDNQTSLGGELYFERGCYVELSGTDPVGQVMLVRTSDAPGVFGPTHYSDSGVRRWAEGDR